jgi:glutamate-1-semialdehyde 2,1-aminomutase
MNTQETTTRVDQFEKSRTCYQDSQMYLAGGVSSNFRLNARPVPLFFERASGARLYSVDGRSYLDYALGMGPVILGHAYPAVISRVSESLSKGVLYAGQHEAETQLGRLVTSILPCAEQVRFGCSGSEVIQAAIRVARAATGKTKVVKFEGHYHGWFDNIYVSVRPSSARSQPRELPGTVPESEGQDPSAFSEIVTLPWNDIASIEGVFHNQGSDIAAVIMEPILCNTCVIPPLPGYLHTVRQLCAEHNAALIFDEVITGFRVGLQGAAGLLGIVPDLAIFAKAMANGFPISCLAGKEELMQLIGSGRVMHGGTYNTNVVATTAAVATIEVLQQDSALTYGRLESLGRALMEELRYLGVRKGIPLLVQGLGPVFNTAFTDQASIQSPRAYTATDAARLDRFIDALLSYGIRITPRGTWFLSLSHTDEDIEETIRAVSLALSEVA